MVRVRDAPHLTGPGPDRLWESGCTVNNPSPRLRPPLQRSSAARIATGAQIGTGSDSNKAMRCDEKVPPVFGTEQDLLTTSTTTRESQDDAPSRAQDRPPAPGPGRGEEGRMR